MQEGLKKKYQVIKADGKLCYGFYFVLKLDSKNKKHAKASRAAVLKYGDLCGNDMLASDLREEVRILNAIDRAIEATN